VIDDPLEVIEKSSNLIKNTQITINDLILRRKQNKEERYKILSPNEST